MTNSGDLMYIYISIINKNTKPIKKFYITKINKNNKTIINKN